ncbi:MAG: hypothetical protein ACT4TC_01000 [Myxococcaceae bacterium]
MPRNTLLSLTAVTLFACGVESQSDPTGDAKQKFSSAEATLLDFEFDGELISDGYGGRSAVDAQVIYTMGHLNSHYAVGRLDKVELTNIVTTRSADGTSARVTYHAKLPVAWGSKTDLPTSYELTLPRAVDYYSLQTFAQKYGGNCAEWGAHDLSPGNFWYYYRPLYPACRLTPGDVVKVTAQVSPSLENTTGKYPEYDQVWSDGVLHVVAIFGKYEDGATASGDAGIAAYNAFLRTLRETLTVYGGVSVPSSLGSAPGVSAPDVQFTAVRPDGRKIVVTALLVDNVSTATAEFYDRYESLSSDADVILYNGHAGLGQNVRALANRGKFVSGKYLIVFMNGCDTVAYVDGSLAQTRAVLNPDDPTGTKYMEIITNAMPAYFSSMPDASMALLNALMKLEAPATYEEIFAEVDRSQVVVVTGEEDNVFVPAVKTSR